MIYIMPRGVTEGAHFMGEQLHAGIGHKAAIVKKRHMPYPTLDDVDRILDSIEAMDAQPVSSLQIKDKKIALDSIRDGIIKMYEKNYSVSQIVEYINSVQRYTFTHKEIRAITDSITTKKTRRRRRKTAGSITGDDPEIKPEPQNTAEAQLQGQGSVAMDDNGKPIVKTKEEPQHAGIINGRFSPREDIF
jgi:hypothetical protein